MRTITQHFVTPVFLDGPAADKERIARGNAQRLLRLQEMCGPMAIERRLTPGQAAFVA